MDLRTSTILDFLSSPVRNCSFLIASETAKSRINPLKSSTNLFAKFAASLGSPHVIFTATRAVSSLTLIEIFFSLKILIAKGMLTENPSTHVFFSPTQSSLKINGNKLFFLIKYSVNNCDRIFARTRSFSLS